MLRQRGFNLIDLMVGLTISLFGLLAVSRVMLTFNQQRNTTVQSIEAQSNGTMALYLLERDLGEAGYGLIPLLNCGTIQWYYGGTQPALSTVPVAIADGGAGSDSITVQYGNTADGAPVATLLEPQGTFGDPYRVSTYAGFRDKDLIVANATNVCMLSQVTTGGVNTVSNTITHVRNPTTPGLTLYNPDVLAPPANWTNSAGAPATSTNIAAGAGALLVNLGNFVSKRYSIVASGLAVAPFPSYAASPLVDGIVFMKAQYGRDTNGDGAVDTWSNGTGAAANAFTIANTNATQVLAVRVGIVARSPLLEKDAIAQPATLAVLPAIGTTDAVTYTLPDLRYRYKTYYTIIPVRNVIWGR